MTQKSRCQDCQDALDVWDTITAEMVSAGSEPFCLYEPGADNGYLAVAEIYAAMEIARLHPDPSMRSEIASSLAVIQRTLDAAREARRGSG